ncbi:Aste57867_14435 [Aphanomyces stellatus]|uniref:Aste57867_14435 protein n=1 Tax=Aphanomyces stellatus TaxID=120398 RepID=A0A485L343_9STRA|nr:hypothetical protein As57867_014381 [Aphanomyces stellatus]VFT91257.1 Aste57867_14435 [Aphanomyces stellatus]
MDEDEEQEIVQCHHHRDGRLLATVVLGAYELQVVAHGSHEPPRRSHHVDQDRAVRTARAHAGAAREHFLRALYFQYLSAQDQDLIVRATVEILSHSMTGMSLDEILARKTTSDSLVAFFIRSGSDAVQDVRNEVIEPVVKCVLSKDLTKHVTILNDNESLKRSDAPCLHLLLTCASLFDLFLLPRFVKRLFSKIVDTYFEISMTQTRIDMSMLLKSKADATAAA